MNPNLIVKIENVSAFLKFCSEKGIKSKMHPDFLRGGYVIRYEGHWMSFGMNKGLKAYKADKRLIKLLKEYHATI